MTVLNEIHPLRYSAKSIGLSFRFFKQARKRSDSFSPRTLAISSHVRILFAVVVWNEYFRPIIYSNSLSLIVFPEGIDTFNTFHSWLPIPDGTFEFDIMG